jgi:nitroreductase
MVRAFDPTPLPDGLLDGLLDTARRAPSAGNCQATTFVVLDRPSLTERYWAVTLPETRRSGFRWQGLLDAPALVLVMTEPERYPDRYREPDKVATGRTTLDDWPVPYWWVDAGAVIQNLLLLVTENGLGACLFGPFDDEPALIEEFELDTGRRIVATITVGHPLPDEPGRSSKRPRRPRSEVIVRPEPGVGR